MKKILGEERNKLNGSPESDPVSFKNVIQQQKLLLNFLQPRVQSTDKTTSTDLS